MAGLERRNQQSEPGNRCSKRIEVYTGHRRQGTLGVLALGPARLGRPPGLK